MIKTITHSVSSVRTLLMAGAAAVVSVAALGFSTGAHARSDVNFSIGVSTPGVVVGVSNAYPVYTSPVYGSPVYGYQPQPVYMQPQPVYVQPRPIYRPHPIYVQAPVYVAPPPVYYPGGHHYRNHGHRSHGHGHRYHGYGHGYYR
ncbi:hypothetical protein [Polaromonas sp.]|uniref:hypothetical protein n=1 Tax=Polaromonas sp. TaxID=1869339 RepID=UPI0025FFD7D3|nr:hypothetical protein [Polaromonas sp.]